MQAGDTLVPKKGNETLKIEYKLETSRRLKR